MNKIILWSVPLLLLSSVSIQGVSEALPDKKAELFE